MSTSRSSALIDSSCTGYRPCTRRRPSLQQQGPPVHSSVTHGAAVREVAPPTVAGAAFPACAGRTAAFSISIPCEGSSLCVEQPNCRRRSRWCAMVGLRLAGSRGWSLRLLTGARSILWSLCERPQQVAERRRFHLFSGECFDEPPHRGRSRVPLRSATAPPTRSRSVGCGNVAPPAFNVSVVIPISFATASRVRRRSAALGCCDPARCVLPPAGAPGGGCRSASLAGSSAAPR